MSQVVSIYDRLESMSDDDIRRIWAALKGYDPTVPFEEGVSMDTWAEAVYHEVCIRGIRS